MLASRSTTALVPIYALACVALVIPAAVWGRGIPYVAGYFLGSCVTWAVLAALIAGVFALFSRSDERSSTALAAFNLALFLIATLSVVTRTLLITS